MAYFSNNNKPKKSTTNNSNPFAFDIDESGHSSASRQRVQEERDMSMINHGEHCTFCGQLDILPCKCDYCSITLCRAHHHPNEHQCKEYISDLTTSPYCDKCHDYIRIPIDTTTTREQYNTIIQEHIDSNCIKHSFKRTEEERKRLKDELRCIALNCNNHTGAGKKLSTLICKGCHKQVCLSHRLPDYHQCTSLQIKQQRETQQQAKKDEFATKVIDQMYGKLSVTDNNDIKGPNATTSKLKELQSNIHQKAQQQCKNPYLLNRQQQIQAKHDKQQQEMNDKEQLLVLAKEKETLEFEPKSYTTIPSRGTLIIHDQINLVNVRTALMQAKPKTKNPANTTITNDNKIYTLIYFPQANIPTTTPQSTENNIPFSTQDSLLTFNQQSYEHVQKLIELDESNTLFTTNIYVPQCIGDGNNNTNMSILEKNAKLLTPVYVALDRNWTIKQCIDEIVKYVNLSSYDNLSKLTKNKTIYTLSMLSFPQAIFTQSSLLNDIIKQYQFDFDLETEMIQEQYEFDHNNIKNGTATKSTSPTTSTNIKSANHRLNTTFLPLHLALGFYIDVN